MEILRSTALDIPRIMEIIEEARAFQLSYGNGQWADGYPSRALIAADAESGIGYKAVEDGMTIGYLAIAGHDDSYDAIEGEWITDGPYIALHRIAFAKSVRGRGLFPVLIDKCIAIARERGCASIRVDTDRRNPIMQHLLSKLGFTFTGHVLFEGDRKLAYELPVGDIIRP